MSDLVFLKELRENVVKGKSDIARHEMALKMIDDWIDELKQKAAQQSVHPTRGRLAQKGKSKSKKVAKPARG